MTDSSLGLTGFVAFRSQRESEQYLCALPDGYEGRSYKTESGKWAVAFRSVEEKK